MITPTIPILLTSQPASAWDAVTLAGSPWPDGERFSVMVPSADFY